MTEQELRQRSEIADARLGVAEELGWVIAFLVLWVVQLKWDAWIGAIIAAIVIYLLLTLSYRRAAAKADDAYFKAARLGKYSNAGGADA